MHFGSCIYSGEDCEIGCNCEGCKSYERTEWEREPCEWQKLKDDNARLSDRVELSIKMKRDEAEISVQKGS